MMSALAKRYLVKIDEAKSDVALEVALDLIRQAGAELDMEYGCVPLNAQGTQVMTRVYLADGKLCQLDERVSLELYEDLEIGTNDQ